jgi:hypothetical protein
MKNLEGMGARETWLFFGKSGLNPFTFQNEWQKRCLAGSTFVGRQTGETVAAVDYDLQFQDVILCQGAGWQIFPPGIWSREEPKSFEVSL